MARSLSARAWELIAKQCGSSTTKGVVRSLGFHVRPLGRGIYAAERPDVLLIAEDVLYLLGLAILDDRRGEACRPTDAEVADLLALDAGAT